MNYRLIKAAIGYPYAYPWKKEKFSLETNELDKILIDYNLDTEAKRRIAGWKIKFSILNESKLVSTSKEVLEKVLMNLKEEKYICEDAVKLYITRLSLDTNENIDLYNKFLLNELNNVEIESNLYKYVIWLLEAVTYYYCSKSKMNSLELEEKVLSFINKLLKEVLNNQKDYSELIKKQLMRSDLLRGNVLNIFTANISNYNLHIENLFCDVINYKNSIDNNVINYKNSIDNNVIEEANKEDEVEGDISASILSLFNSSTALKLNDDEINEIQENIELKKHEELEKNNIVKTNELITTNDNVTTEEVDNNVITKEVDENVTIEKADDNNNEVFNNLKALSSSLGYQIANKDEMVISKDKYNKLIDTDNEKGIILLKELALFRNGAILSELYNAHKNINDISKENLEAILTNFFVSLSLNGFEVIDDKDKVGDSVTVNTNNVLKEFVFTNAINKIGQVDGKIEYLAWRYKGKQVVPMVVKPIV